MEADSNVIVTGNKSRETEAEKIEVDNNGSEPKKRPSTAPLRSCFNAIVKGKKIHLDIKTLELIIVDELRIKIEHIDPKLRQILPYMLVSYVKSWPGWIKNGEYLNGSLKIDDWFSKFQQYTTFKLQYLIQKEYPKVLNEIINEDLNSCETQTENLFMGGKPFSSFSLNFEGPPTLLNTLIFSSHDDDIISAKHPMKPWSEGLNLQQLINWPNLEIEFCSPFMTITRRMVPNYLRYLANVNDLMSIRKQDFIEEVRVNSDSYRTEYSVPFLGMYLMSYIQYLKTLKLDNQKFIEMQTFLSEFFKDVVELSQECENRFHNSTAICFNIGRCRYVRNKKAANICTQSINNPPPSVGFCEVITPRCSIELKKLYTDQITGIDSDNPIMLSSYFATTQEVLDKKSSLPTLVGNAPSMMYSCYYCKKQYEGTYAVNAILKHFQDEHKMEHEIRCYQCKKQYNVADLSQTRWYHSCVHNPNAKNPNLVNIFSKQ
ncbi:hypothetical protein HHI36_015679 [Cryptolaemus montrouzieri]|uniref:C2H2-type domain-containing protein n=1 Tax=Cryptolaemus montrouzieri TaxID=559131 RepID=A0ABD2N6D9_9CUCU